MLKRKTPKLLFVLLFSLPFAAAQASLTGGNEMTVQDVAKGITVTATGTAYGEPNQVSFNAGVSVLDADVQAATAQVDERISSLMEALKDAGVASEDIRTSSFTIYPEQSYGPDGQPGETRYRVTNTLHVTVRDTAQLGELLGRSVQAGANEIYNVVYTFSDRSALEQQARRQAMNAAREKAEQLARFSGATLGQVRQIIEGEPPFEGEPISEYRLESAAGSEMPVSSGQLAVIVNLRVTFGLD